MREAEPRGWLRPSIGEIAEINPRQYSVEPKASDLVSFVPMAAVEAMSGQMDPSQQRAWRDVSSGFVRFQNGDVLFAKITPCMENGKFAVAKALVSGRAAGSTEFHVLRPLGGMDPAYLLYFLLQESVRRDAKARMQGAAGQLRVPKQYLAELEIPLAPLAEQRRIVAAIEEHLSRLDAAVAGLKRVQAQLPRYRAAVLKAAVEGSLLGEDRAREGEANDQIVSKGTRWLTVEECAAQEPRSITDGPFGSNLKTEHYTESGPRVIRLQNIGDGEFVDARSHISADRYQALKKHAVFPGDVLIAALGENPPRACLAPAGLGPAIVKADCIRLKPNPDLALPEYLNIALNAHPTRRRVTKMLHGVGRPRLNLSEIRSIALPVPSLSDQAAIVAEVERRLSLVRAISATVEAALARAANLRQSVLRRAFSGQLVPQDPNDEPASLLLERIRAGRAAQQGRIPSGAGPRPRGPRALSRRSRKG